MDGDRKTDAEFTIERGGEKERGASTSSPRGASNVPPRERAEQAEFDLGAKGQRQANAGMPERLRRKYYVAEGNAGAEAKVYADPKREYLAFKVTTQHMATRLEDASVIRDMVSIAQHRNWKEVELRGSEEFRRTAWLEASVRGLAVRGYEPDPVDRAALAFKTKADAQPARAPSQPQQRDAGASETVFAAGVTTTRPIEATVLPPERRTDARPPRFGGAAPMPSPSAPERASPLGKPHAAEQPAARPIITIDVAPFRMEPSGESTRPPGQRRADLFRSGDHRKSGGDDVVSAARSQFAAIERVLIKAIRDPELRRSVLTHAKKRIAEQLEWGGEFKHAELRERTKHRPTSPNRGPDATRQKRSNVLDVYQER